MDTRLANRPDNQIVTWMVNHLGALKYCLFISDKNIYTQVSDAGMHDSIMVIFCAGYYMLLC